MKALLLTYFPSSEATKKIIDTGERSGMDILTAKPFEFCFFGSGDNSDSQLFHKEVQLLKKDIGVIIPRLGGKMPYGLPLLRHINKCMGVPSIATANGLLNCSNKLTTAQILSCNNINVPLTTYFYKGHDYNELISKIGGFPCVAKSIYGSNASTVFLLKDDSAASMFFRATRNEPILLQRFIETAKVESERSVLKVWVVDNDVVSSAVNYTIEDNFRTTSTSIVGKGNATVLQKEIAINSVKALGLELGVVDIVTEYETGDSYVLEINGCPEVLNTYSDIDFDEYIIAYAKHKAGEFKNAKVKSYLHSLVNIQQRFYSNKYRS